MTHLYRQVTGVSTPLCVVQLKNGFSKRRKLRKRPLWCSAGGKGQVGEPTRPNPKFSQSDIQRICTHGPTIDDLKLMHSTIKKYGITKTVNEDVYYVRALTLDGGMDVEEPKWHNLQEIPFMQFYKGVEERNWRSEFYKPDSAPWQIVFFEDCGRLFRPSFAGYRALIVEEGKDAVWCNLPEAGLDPFDEDVAFNREPDDLTWTQRHITSGYPEDYGYLQVFHNLGLAYQQQIPKQYLNKYRDRGYLRTKEAKHLITPGDSLLDVSFSLTRQEPCLHGIWLKIPLVLFVTFSLSFLGACLTLGVFKPKKQMPADPVQAMEFAQSKGRARRDGRTGVLLSDVAGLDKLLDDLNELIEFLKAPTQYKELRARPPKGLLIDGPPGTGKTLVAKAIAGEAGVPFYQMTGSEFVEAIVGVGAARVRDLFKRARAQEEACIIFVDEIDALGARRADAGLISNEEREQTLNQLLTEMDGFSSESGVVFVAATNRSDLLDPALTRPGRFDRKICVVLPDTEARHQILKLHARPLKMSKDVDLLQMARDLPGVAGADLANALNEAALEAIRRDGKEIIPKDISNALDRIIEGNRNPVQPISTTLARRFALHEMGRAIVATVLRERTGRLEAVEKVSVISRGRSATRTVFFRGKDEDYTLTTRGRMLERLRVILAGRAAEQHFYGDLSTYSAKDLGPAFRIAEKIVSNYALTEIGITSYARVSRRSRETTRDYGVDMDYSDENLYSKRIDGGMFQPSDSTYHKMLTKCYELVWEAFDESLDLIMSYSNALEAGAKILLEKKQLTGSEVEKIIRQYPPRPLKKPITSDAYAVAPQSPSPLSIRYATPEDATPEVLPPVARESEVEIEEEETACPT